MDKGEHPEQRLLAHAVKAMEPLGLQFRILRPEAPDGDHRADAMIGLRFGGRRLRYLAEVKRGLRPATLGAVIHQLRAYGGIPLLVTDHVTPPLADALRAQGVEFIDAAGNAFLNQPPLLVFVKGQRPADGVVALERGRAFQATGLQVLFALVARPVGSWQSCLASATSPRLADVVVSSTASAYWIAGPKRTRAPFDHGFSWADSEATWPRSTRERPNGREAC